LAIVMLAALPSTAISDDGHDASEAPAELPLCVQRLWSLVPHRERIEVRTEDGIHGTGRFEGFADGVLLLGSTDPEESAQRAVPLETITGVAYWRREEFQPDWIFAGLATGVMAGALIGAMTGEDESFDPAWLRGAAIGAPIGISLGFVTSITVPKKHVISCAEEK
jgi:hypothetical protein